MHLAKKATVRIPSEAILAMLMAAIIAIVMLSLFLAYFSGQQHTTFKTFASELEQFCKYYSVGQSKSFYLIMPDSAGNTPLNLEFFYIGFTDTATTEGILGKKQYQGDVLVLGARRYSDVHPNDAPEGEKFIEWFYGIPGERIVEAKELEACTTRRIKLCGCKQESCAISNNIVCVPGNNFKFEAIEGYTNLLIELTRSDANTVTINVGRKPICGDLRCCEGENISSCDVDCDANKNADTTCAKFTASS